jgi:hypothetical protein
MKTLLQILALLLFLNSSVKSQTPPPPPLQAGEVYTGLYSVSYDYQTNGCVRYIVQDPSNPKNLCAILMAQQDSNNAAGVSRYIYYAYSEDNGVTWTAQSLDETANWGFPDMSLNNGVPIIAAHRFNTGTSVFKDLFFGAYGFAQLQGVPPGTNWSHLSGTENGNIVMVGAPNDNIFIGQATTYNGTSWSPLLSMPLIGGPSGNFSVAAGTGGVVGVFGTNYINDGYIYWYKSTDNGVTFDNGTMIFNYLLDGTDTLFASITGGLQAAFQGSEPHLVFTAYNVKSTVFPDPNTTEFVNPSILHWSPSSGVTKVCGKFNIPSLADTITTALMAPVGQPSIRVSSNNTIVCSYTTFLWGNTQVVNDGSVLNTGEILYSQSNNNGVNWSTPVNITNTPGIEEKHSSLVEKSPSDTVKIYYLRDMKAGGWVNIPAWGIAPVYGIYKNLGATVGISQTSTELKSFNLSQNYPNPFNPTTTIRFDIPKSEFTTLLVYDINGREVGRLVNEKLSPGSYEFQFSSADHNLSSGVYIYKLVSGNFVDTKKMILLK